MLSLARLVITLLTALVLAVSFNVSAFAEVSSVLETDYSHCQTEDETSFRKSVRLLTLAALQSGTQKFDYSAAVDEQWRLHNMDAIVDRQVDLSVQSVRSETSWGQLLKSLAYREKASELATAVAERVYRSKPIRDAFEAVATDVGTEIGRAIVLTTADAARPAQRCLRAFLGPRYGSTIARAVIGKADAAFTLDPDDSAVSIGAGSVALSASRSIAGAVILLMRRQLVRLTRRVGQRVVGAVLGRIVSIVAGGVGLVLIAKDVWDFRYGILPIVSTELKSEETKIKVRRELADTIELQIAAQLGELSDSLADQIVDIWRGFRLAHNKVVELAGSNSAFKNFTDSVPPDRLARLDEIVAITLREGGEVALLDLLSRGTLQRALQRLDPHGMQIARETGSLEAALLWSDIAREDLNSVIEADLHKQVEPNKLSRVTLQRILHLKDPVVVSRVASVNRETRDALFGLGEQDMKSLVLELDVGQLETLTSYLNGLVPPAKAVVLERVARTPSLMAILAPERVRSAILASRDQHAAVTMMLRQSGGFDVKELKNDIRLLLDRRVSPVLIWDRHPMVVIAFASLVVLVLLVLRRIILPPRNKQNQLQSGA